MPRKARLNVPGAIYHVMSRCLDHYVLFNDDEDSEFFLSLLERYLVQAGVLCYAWALMNNHYHLVLRVGEVELGRIMKPLNMHYAYYHRKKYPRRGPLFMDRFKSIATQDQHYVEELIRYVHLNALRAGICKDLDALEKYPWSGHCALMNAHVRRSFHETESVLKRFGSTVKDARGNLREYMALGVASQENDDVLVSLVRKSNAGSEEGRSSRCWVIGDREFVVKALESAAATHLRISRFEKEGGDLEIIARSIGELFGVSVEEMKKRHRGNTISMARMVFAHSADRHYQAPHRLIAEFLNVGATAISGMSRKGSVIMDEMGKA